MSAGNSLWPAALGLLAVVLVLATASGCQEPKNEQLSAAGPGERNFRQLQAAIKADDYQRFCQLLSAADRRALLSATGRSCQQALASDQDLGASWQRLLARGEFVTERRAAPGQRLVFIRQQPGAALSTYALRWEKGSWRAEIIAINNQ